MKYRPSVIAIRQFIMELISSTFLISLSRPFMAKYKKPPEVNARLSFRYILPSDAPIAVPRRAPAAVVS